MGCRAHADYSHGVKTHVDTQLQYVLFRKRVKAARSCGSFTGAYVTLHEFRKQTTAGGCTGKKQQIIRVI
jgi:hypothetical protein